MRALEFLKILAKNHSFIGGVDEAGRGPLAGPVMAAIVIMEQKDLKLLSKTEIKDSKKLTPKKREKLFTLITRNFPFGVGLASPQTIDRLNILGATFLAMKRSISDLKIKHKLSPQIIIIDGNQIIPNLSIAQKNLPRADELIPLVSAASIIAKVSRDRLITQMAELYPQYGFELHKGYGTKKHLENLKKFGPCPIHRKSFGPVKKMLI
ncbi:MAG: ribonuclease HII [Patescibacteria group bacterium]|nr:ribonuclease HII [Patescibacteria group bacterium]